MSEYIYYNVNPQGERTEDCVCRSISLATGSDYYDIKEMLADIGAMYGCDSLCVCCYNHLLENVFHLKHLPDTNISIGDFADKHPNGIFLVRVNGHISCIIDNTVFDIWDCRNEIITDAWKVE